MTNLWSWVGAAVGVVVAATVGFIGWLAYSGENKEDEWSEEPEAINTKRLGVVSKKTAEDIGWKKGGGLADNVEISVYDTADEMIDNLVYGDIDLVLSKHPLDDAMKESAILNSGKDLVEVLVGMKDNALVTAKDTQGKSVDVMTPQGMNMLINYDLDNPPAVSDIFKEYNDETKDDIVTLVTTLDEDEFKNIPKWSTSESVLAAWLSNNPYDEVRLALVRDPSEVHWTSGVYQPQVEGWETQNSGFLTKESIDSPLFLIADVNTLAGYEDIDQTWMRISELVPNSNDGVHYFENMFDNTPKVLELLKYDIVARDNSHLEVLSQVKGPSNLVTLNTSFGNIEILLDEENTPVTTENFIQYVDEGFYKDTIFHRVIDNYMIQAGGFDLDMNEKIARDSIMNESNLAGGNLKGTVAMARAEPHTATSQFFINLRDNNFLDFKGKTPEDWGYTVFGEVVNGMDVVDDIAKVKTVTRDYMSDVPDQAVVIVDAVREYAVIDITPEYLFGFPVVRYSEDESGPTSIFTTRSNEQSIEEMSINEESESLHGGKITIAIPEINAHRSFFTDPYELGILTSSSIGKFVEYDEEANSYTSDFITWEQHPYGKEFVIEIKPKAEFHNGDSIKPIDLANSLLMAKAFDATRWDHVELAYVKSDKTVVVELSHASPDFISLLHDSKISIFQYFSELPYDIESQARWSYVDDPALLSEIRTFAKNNYSLDTAFNTGTGIGPYEIIDINDGVSVRYERFEDSSLLGGHVRPYLDEIEYIAAPELSTRFALLEYGEVDAIQLRQLELPTISQDITNRLEDGSLEMEAFGNSYFWDLKFDLIDDSPVQEQMVRKAMNHAIENTYINREVFNGQATTMDSHLLSTNSSIDPPDLLYEYDPELAGEMLADAGYKNGFDVNLLIFSGYGKVIKNMADIIVGELDVVGISVNIIEVGSYVEYQDHLFKHTEDESIATDWDLVLSLSSQYDDPLMYLKNEFTDQSGFQYSLYSGGIISQTNITGYANGVIDVLLAQVENTSDANEKNEKYKIVFEILNDELPTIPLFEGRNYVVHKSEINGMENLDYGLESSLDELWLSA